VVVEAGFRIGDDGGGFGGGRRGGRGGRGGGRGYGDEGQWLSKLLLFGRSISLAAQTLCCMKHHVKHAVSGYTHVEERIEMHEWSLSGSCEQYLAVCMVLTCRTCSNTTVDLQQWKTVVKMAFAAVDNFWVREKSVPEGRCSAS